ncbi:hypothetical protein B0T17DRAFT_502449 [Bombardia bombarda]|uniref:histidine kinase n=1 Tax=Bombardia bombarda TaxID=252184 RepID=A0AA39XIV8_9PEZI|nr:hypothetical protein B0T17DRAFT_502449 [Bombardia bombarda]
MTGGSNGGGGSDPLHVPASGARSAEKTSIVRQEDEESGAENVAQRQPPRSVDMGATDAQRQLSQYRQLLAQEMENREAPAKASGSTVSPSSGRVRISPIQEEGSATSSPPPFQPQQSQQQQQQHTESEATTTSTESGKTIRGGMTPGYMAGTPSYPFPRMTSPGFMPSSMHRPFTTLSPTTAPMGDYAQAMGPLGQDSVLSNPSTPASAMTFLPQGYSGPPAHPHDFPTPNLYDLTLLLTAEPGLDAWWNTVVQIMTEVYKAERVTLAIPADSTDIENVPWGQKATYNAHQEDGLSLGYMARGSSYVQSSVDNLSESISNGDDSLKPKGQIRPELQSRHSFTSYEDKKDRKATAERTTPAALRRPAMSRSKTTNHVPSLDSDANDDNGASAALNRQALEEHDAIAGAQTIPSWEAPITNERDGQGKILSVLQALDYEADPLIDHNGVQRVLERGRVVALTRTYPYLGQTAPENKSSESKPAPRSNSPEGGRKRLRKPRSDSTSKLSSLLASAKLTSAPIRSHGGQLPEKKATPSASRIEDDEPRPATPKYEEYEQALPSPWSQSPAPSPAVRADPNENPFFTDAMVDEESFNPDAAPANYSTLKPPEAIGVDNSWTVLHIPLTHVFLSKPNPAFRLDSTLMEQKIFARGKSGEPSNAQTPNEPASKERHPPIAILSILSPIIPYPSNLRYSLEHLAPHLATSFSLCRHYTNMEIELNGLQKRRPATAGFGAIGPDGRLLADPTALATLGYMQPEDVVSRGSLAGSITSPSDYSGPTRSTAGSPTGTPSWDPAGLGFIMEKRASGSSPLAIIGDSYFSTKPKLGSVGQRTRRNSKEGVTPDRRGSLRLSGGKGQWQELALLTSPTPEPIPSSESADEAPASAQPKRTAAKDSKDHSPVAIHPPAELQRKSSGGPSTTQTRHTQLHSYGADFASTFQSLPPSSTIGKGVPQPHIPSRSGSVSQSTEMTPPSDKLKGLILDSLPAHVFVALPQTGEIVWVNSRFLTYRGQNSGDLAIDPWASIHSDDREDYLRAWSHSVRTGEQFSRTVRIRRFDGAYRWFYARAVASKDKRGVILQFLGSYMDIHDQHIAELRAARQEEIEASEAKHRLLANLIPQIIFTATENEGITFANEQWLSYTGQSFENSLGWALWIMSILMTLQSAKFLPIERRRHFLRASGKVTNVGVQLVCRYPVNALSSGSSVGDIPNANLTELARKGIVKVSTDSNGRLSYTTEIRLRSKTGDYRWHLIRCVEIDNVDFGNGASSYFGSATDINDLKLLETKLKEAMESKSRFLSNMSHEIRTPLIGISGMVSFLQDTTLNEEQRDYTNTIQTSANSLIMIINDILDLSKVDAGMMKLNHEWFHTRSLIEDVNELVSTMAIAKRLELNYVVEEDVPAWVKGDKVRVRQVLLNVIGNAIKFTNQGEVFSKCKVIVPEEGELADDEVMLEFSIVDTGRGFTKEEAELIFKPFSQIDGSSTRQHGGSGLGLVISRQLVELHGGKMDGFAVPGKGSTFTFTAKFGLPAENDYPDTNSLPRPTPVLVPDTPISSTKSSSSPSQHIIAPLVSASPSTIDPDQSISPAGASTGSSIPSINSTRTHITDRSSMSSVNVGLVRFSEAARASGQDLSQMKLEMPHGRNSPGTTPTPINEHTAVDFRPPIYSILIVCPQMHSREATTKHIEMTLPKDIPHQITALGPVDEAKQLIGGDDPVVFTHVVVNLPLPEEIIDLMDEIMRSSMAGRVTVVILSDSVQRQAVMKQVVDTKYEEVLSESNVTYIYKPVKPSRFAVIFDPAKERDLSIDRNRSTAQKLVENQKQSYIEMEKRIGNKGYKVLLVEDNPVNQKVLQKYLKKIGVIVELAADGVECTEMVFAQPHGYFSLILCDLHMPRKDGYQACREIRDWEARQQFQKMPIIALSANVMSDVQEKCVQAGFSDYVTKPVDFINLSNALSGFF